MSPLLRISLAVSIAVLLPTAAPAADACRDDTARFCQGIAPGGGRIVSCLKSHEAELAPACRQQFDEARERLKTFAESCRPDAERLCKGIPPGKGRIAACLRSHQAELAPACKEAMAR